ncbi:MAG: NYN domain-containing protein [Dehalococcoidia bacterium]|nr:NYN domain-containing protein [Dehalococcoidia bacterium]
MPERIAIFIDGGYLDYVLKDLGIFGKLDYRAFADALKGHDDLLRAYYYHCLPWQSPHPTPQESERFANMQKFLDSVDRIPRYMVRKGRLAYRGTRSDGTPIFEQKQVDILLASDIVLLSAKRQVSEIILVSGDSDFLPAVRIARDEGVVVQLAHGGGKNRPHNELWNTADERVELDARWFASCLKPELPPP